MHTLAIGLDDQTIERIISGTAERVIDVLNINKDFLPNAGDNDYLSRKEVASELNICTATVSKLVEKGELPKPVGRGRNARWRRGDIRAYAFSKIK